MQSIVITGGNSLIGRHLIQKLDKDRCRVVALVRNAEKVRQIPGVRYVELPMERYGEIADYLDACDVFIPLAWCGCRRGELDDAEKNRFSFETNRDAIRLLIDRFDCKKVILPGSHHEYRPQNSPIDERTAQEPALAYGKERLRLYREIGPVCEANNVSCVELRLFSVYGEDSPEDKMIKAVLRKLLNNETVYLRHGRQTYSFLHADDAADAFLRVIQAPSCVSGYYNVSSNCHMQLAELVRQMKECAGSSSEIICEDAPGADEIHTIVLSGEMSARFGWTPRVDFRSGIERMLHLEAASSNGWDAGEA